MPSGRRILLIASVLYMDEYSLEDLTLPDEVEGEMKTPTPKDPSENHPKECQMVRTDKKSCRFED